MKKIMFCGGGSAGHVIPNIALYEQLKDRYELSYLGTDGIEKDICAEKRIRFFQFDGVKLVRGKFFCNLSIPSKLCKSVKRCKEILAEEKPDLLFCKGGYVSVPAAFAANKLGIPVFTHESDLSSGLANRLIAGKCERVLTAFPETSKKIKNGVYTGTPMRTELFGKSKIQAKERFGLDMRPCILVFGGGSGSAKINATVRKIAAKLCRDYNLLHVCGKGNKVDSNIPGYVQIEFTEDMGTVYACADYAVARCGANSANELTALKIPALFIPLENRRSRGDQVANAEYFRQRGLCRVLRERDLGEAVLEEEIHRLVGDEKIKTALAHYGAKSGNENVIREIERAIGK